MNSFKTAFSLLNVKHIQQIERIKHIKDKIKHIKDIERILQCESWTAPMIFVQKVANFGT